MTSSYTIAHIADLHLSAEHKRFNLRRARRLLDAVAGQNVDHVVVTGDIAADANRRDFEIAHRLFRSAGLTESGRLSVVIGNHDIFGGVHAAEDILSFPRRCREVDYARRVEEFRVQFHESFERCLFASDSNPFPFAKILGNIVLIGMNSVARYSKVKNPVGSNGEVGDGQLKRFRQLCEIPEIKRKRKLVLIHHHFNKSHPAGAGLLNSTWGVIERQTMKLRGKKALLELFREQGVELVLHGHVHTTVEYERKGIRFLNSGGALLGPPEAECAFHLIKVAPEGIEISRVSVPGKESSLPSVRPIPRKIPDAELQAA